MITKKEISDFAEFCQVKYRVKFNPVIIDDFIQTYNSNSDIGADIQNINEHKPLMGCSSNNIECTHLTFDCAKCNECPY